MTFELFSDDGANRIADVLTGASESACDRFTGSQRMRER